MNEELIEAQVSAARVVCSQLTSWHLKALHDSVERACRVRAAVQWHRKAAAHADIFHVLAAAASDPRAARVLSSGAGLARDLMVAAGRGVDGMITGLHRRMLARLRAGDAEGAVREMNEHLRVLDYVWRLAHSTADRIPREQLTVTMRGWRAPASLSTRGRGIGHRSNQRSLWDAGSIEGACATTIGAENGKIQIIRPGRQWASRRC